MQPRTLRALQFAGAFGGQTLLLSCGWAFLGTVLVENPLILPDHLAVLAYSWSAETTWMVTIIATVFAVATTTFLSIAFKEALLHRMHDSISLINLSSGIAITRGAFLINFRHPIPTLVTLVVFGLAKLLVSSWSTLLIPTLVSRNVNATGWELDLTSSWFEAALQQELIQSGAALVRGNSSEIIDIGGVMSGIAAMQYSFGVAGIFTFNGAQYNVSTGGVLPAAPMYGGTNDSVLLANNSGLAFSGGQIPTHLEVIYPNGDAFQGVYSTYTLWQQGLSANVSCRPASTTTDNLSLSPTYQSMPVPFLNGTTDYWLWAWNITLGCDQGQPSQQQYVTTSNSSSVPQLSTTGLLSSLVCPYPLGQTNLSWEHLDVVTSGNWKYDFLPLTVCTIDPYLTTSRVTYSGGVIDAVIVDTQALGSSNSNLSLFLAAILDYQSRTTQGLTANTIGDALYSVYISASKYNSTTPEEVTVLLLQEMENYWRGVTEFAGTFLRSAFSVYPWTIPAEAQTSVTGYETIASIGWSHRSRTYGFTIIPITTMALVFYGAVAYTLWNIYFARKRGRPLFSRFDPSNPIHLMMVSSTQVLSDAKDDLSDVLGGFEHDGIRTNENVRVGADGFGERAQAIQNRQRAAPSPAIKFRPFVAGLAAQVCIRVTNRSL